MIDTESAAWRQTRLLVEILPVVAAEECFALKGGTAINLFILDLARLSVDIDLTYLPREDHATAVAGIDAALRRIAAALRSLSPPYVVNEGNADKDGRIDTLNVRARDAGVKIEVNPVLRGTIHPVRVISIRPEAERRLGFARMQVLSEEDLYGGKLVAALDRQHPRDLFDAKLLMEGSGISEGVLHGFLLYLAGHKGVMAHTLEPRSRDIAELHRTQFDGMTEQTASVEELVAARERLIRELRARIGGREKRFLLSVKRGEPDWSLLPVAGAADWPPVLWKLHNLERLRAEQPARHAEALTNLERVLEQMAG